MTFMKQSVGSDHQIDPDYDQHVRRKAMNRLNSLLEKRRDALKRKEQADEDFDEANTEIDKILGKKKTKAKVRVVRENEYGLILINPDKENPNRELDLAEAIPHVEKYVSMFQEDDYIKEENLRKYLQAQQMYYAGTKKKHGHYDEPLSSYANQSLGVSWRIGHAVLCRLAKRGLVKKVRKINGIKRHGMWKVL